jgi:hypothetical protein
MQYYSDFAVKAAKDLLTKTYKYGACFPSASRPLARVPPHSHGPSSVRPAASLRRQQA